MTTRYAVTGSTAFLGHAPGDEFEADLDPGLERRALERGQIKPVHKKTPAKKEDEADE